MPSSVPTKVDPATREKLLAGAREALNHAYAPYSKFHVGAAILTSGGAVFTGCNVENASYGLTICAERNAIFAAVAAQPPGEKLAIDAVAIATRPASVAAPCGACRQVIAEFAGKVGVKVFYQGDSGTKESTIAQLLPDTFSF
jgi:cytidine deaminase